MKKIFAIVMAMMIVFSLVACGGKTNTPTPTTAPVPETTVTPETIVPVEETTEVPEVTEETEPVVVDGPLKPYNKDFEDGLYMADLEYIGDNKVNVGFYTTDLYDADRVANLQAGDIIVVGGEEIEIKTIERIADDIIDTVVINAEEETGKVELVREVIYDYTAEVAENEEMNYTLGDYTACSDEGYPYYTKIETKEVELTADIYFTDSTEFDESTNSIVFKDLTGLDLLEMLKTDPTRFNYHNTQVSVFEGAPNSFNLIYQP